MKNNSISGYTLLEVLVGVVLITSTAFLAYRIIGTSTKMIDTAQVQLKLTTEMQSAGKLIIRALQNSKYSTITIGRKDSNQPYQSYIRFLDASDKIIEIYQLNNDLIYTYQRTSDPMAASIRLTDSLYSAVFSMDQSSSGNTRSIMVMLALSKEKALTHTTENMVTFREKVELRNY